MRSLINDLLKFSRVTKETPIFKQVSLKIILEEVLEILKNVIDSSKATITYDPVSEIDCIPNLLGEVFQNLFENAIKFKKANFPPIIHVSVKSDKDMWIFSVIDNGIGVNSKYAERIFIPFQRLHKQNEKPGNGIGLAIVKKIIEMHGGKIRLESMEGEGSNFIFMIPKKRINEEGAS
jgi:light-regulated signal transduction histidine kinase (bacteriophytochrome)